MRNVPGSNMLAGIVDVMGRVIEKKIGAESLQKGALVPAPQKQGFIKSDPPFTKRQHHPLMGRSRTGGDQCRSNRTSLSRKKLLKIMQCR